MSRFIDIRGRFFGAVFVIAAAMILFGQNSTRHDAAAFNVKEIDVATAKQLLESGVVFIDVRSQEAFIKGHVAGAVSIPLAQLRSAIEAKMAIDATKPVVIYCGDGVSTGPEGTYVMNQAGYASAVNLKGGIETWKSAGLPVASGGG